MLIFVLVDVGFFSFRIGYKAALVYLALLVILAICTLNCRWLIKSYF